MNAQTAAAAVATLVSIACTVTVARRARDRAAIRAPLIAWTIAFGLFTIADAALWYGAARGWTGPVFRLYYLTGGILVVAYLAVGELLLVLPGRRVARVTAATMLFLTFAAISGVLAAQVDDGQARRRRGRPAERRAGRNAAGRAGDRAELGRNRGGAGRLGAVGPPPARLAAAAGGGRAWGWWRSPQARPVSAATRCSRSARRSAWC